MPQASAQAVLAVGSLIFIGAALALLFFKEIPANNAQTIGVVLGYVAGWGSASYQYYFGSSKSSQTKDDTISSLTRTVGAGDGQKGSEP